MQQQWISHLSASKIYISVFLSLAWNLTGKILSKAERLVATICRVLRKALLFIATDNLARSPPSWAVRGLSGGRARCWRAAWSQPQPHHQAQPLPAARPLPQPCCSPHPQQDAKGTEANTWCNAATICGLGSTIPGSSTLTSRPHSAQS